MGIVWLSTQGENWSDNENWPLNAWPSPDTVSWMDFALWYGVDVENGDVNNLKLQDNSLVGDIPEEISYLTAMDYFDLNDNAITSLPPSIGDLANLTLFYLTNNALTSLPVEIGRLSNLQNFHLTNNNLQRIPDSIGNCFSLLRLYLSDNDIDTLPPTIGNLDNLLDLHVAGNNLSALPSSIGSLSNINSLSLRNNKLTVLPPEIGQLLTLSSLTVNGNQLTGLPAEVGQLVDLFKLNISGNDISFLPDEITQLANLNILYADSNNLSVLPQEIGLLTSLTTLTLSGNQFTQFPPQILDIPFLMELHLNGNDISSVPEGIDILYDLTFFYAADNRLSSLPASMGNLPWLWGINVAGNPFNGFPQEVLGYNELFELDVSRLSLESLPTGIADSLIYLSDLYVSGNDLDFADLEQFFTSPGESIFPYFYYAPQNDIQVDTSLFVHMGQSLEFAVPVGGTQNIYLWKKRNAQGEWEAVDTTSSLDYTMASKEHDGKYQVEVTSRIVSGLTLRTSGEGIDIDVYYQNYIRVENILVAGITDNQAVGSLSIGEKSSQWTYFDGLQRTLQVVQQEASPTGHDLVQPVAYDELQRQPVSYLPYTTANLPNAIPGHLRPNALYGEQEDFYATPPPNVAQEAAYAFSETGFEPSPLSRVKEQGGLGEALSLDNGHTSTQEYLTNTIDEVLYWKVVNGQLQAIGYYEAGQLRKTVSEGPQGNQSITYSDRWKGIVLQKTQLNVTTWASTYYVYDQYGNLTHKLTPLAVKQIESQTGFPKTVDATVLEQQCYQFMYDNQQRLIEEKAPGIGPVYYVYDRWDRLVLSQDGNQRQINQWSFTKYDFWNSPVMSGLCTDTRPVADIRIALQNLTDAQRYESRDAAGAHGYSNHTFPTAGIDKVLLVSYYDDYDFISNQGLDAAYQYKPLAMQGLPAASHSLTRGLLTGTKVNILDTDDYLWTIPYYNDEFRAVQVVSGNHMGGIDRVSSQYNFAGWLLKAKLIKQEGDPANEVTITQRKEYDHAGRLTKSYHQVNSQPEVLLAQFHYNELGQLTAKGLHSVGGVAPLQSVDYRYNIRGQLMAINSSDLAGSSDGDYFGMEFSYDDLLVELSNTPQYNGNISAASWSSLEGDVTSRAYSYDYDKGNRLQEAQHHKKATAWAAVNAYSVPHVGYDENGNIEDLTRKDGTGADMDALTYHYGGNKLTSVVDAGNKEKGLKDGNLSGDDYGYDANGNLTFDKNLGVSLIEYYHNNQPKKISFTNGMAIEYSYDAAGNKLSQKVFEPGQTIPDFTTDYAGGFIYYNGLLQLIHHEAGRLVPNTSGGFVYEYHLTDHLGNVRVTFTSEPETEVMVATVESQQAQEEEAQFLKLDETRISTIQAIDHTGSSEAPKVTRLNGAHGITDGPAKGLRVMPGDKVRIEVYAKYLDMRQSSSKVTGAALLSLMMQAASGTVLPGDPAQAAMAQSSLPSGAIAALGASEDHAPPRAFLNYLLFDNNFNQVDAGFMQVSEEAAITPENLKGGHEKLVLEVTVTEPGYLFTNLSHDEAENVDIYFDDFTITHEHGSIVQVQDYYPYGLTFNENMKANAVLNKYLYQGKERLEETGWQDFHARMYSPALGRFLSVDPQNQFASGFTGMGNNPIMYVDPDGELAWFVPLIIGAVINVGVNAAAGNIDNFWQGAGYAAVGAASGAIGSGIASGVSVAISGVSAGASFGSSFAAGFGSAFSGSVGTGILPAATSSFFSGAAIGAGAGFGAGFVGGVGNGLVSGENLGGALGQGINSGIIGGISGGLMGGIAGGIGGLRSGGEFWSNGYENASIPSIKPPKSVMPAYELGLSGLSPIPQPRAIFLQQIVISANKTPSYYSAALGFKGVPYLWGGMTHCGIDCSGLVNRATGQEKRVWTTHGGNPPGNWKRVYPSTSSIDKFIAESRVGDLYVWPKSHTAFYGGNGQLFHAHGVAGTPTGFTGDLRRYYLVKKGFPLVYRQN